MAEVRLTENARKEWTDQAPESDYAAEGFEYLSRIGAKVNGFTPTELWRDWHEHPRELYVIRFERVSVVAPSADGQDAKRVPPESSSPP